LADVVIFRLTVRVRPVDEWVMHPFSCRWFSVLGLSLGLVSGPAGRGAPGDIGVNVSAGAFDRHEAIVSLKVPQGWAAFTQAQAPNGSAVPFQVGADGRAWFVAPKLVKGAAETFYLKSAPLTAAATNRVTVERRNMDLALAITGRGEVCVYRAAPTPLPRADIKPVFQRGGYLHPLFSPSGKTLTDDYPANHLHHHGVWVAWPRTEFEARQPNFWEMGVGTGTVLPLGVADVTDGPVWGGFVARHQFVDLSASPPKPALNETWSVRLYNLGQTGRAYYLLDLTFTQSCAGVSPLKLPEYRYGGLGVRGNGAWNGRDNTSFLTSEGETDRVKGNTSRGRWCALGGNLDGRPAGLAVLGHPGNFRAPQPMRLHPDEPFLCFAPTQAGEFSITPAEPLVAHYRLVLFDGPPDRAELDRLWNDFASPPTATISMP
jgi:hypothetical protein